MAALAKSYNGWPASKVPADFGGLDNRIVPGTTHTKLSPGVRAGDFADVAFAFCEQLNLRVEKGDLYTAGVGDEWGWYWKMSANSAALLSCHSGGTGWDWNATRHPNGKRGTFTKAQVAEIRKIQAEFGGIIYWGGDAWGDGTPDEMHFELKTGVTPAQLKAEADKVRARVLPVVAALIKYAFPIDGSISACYLRVGGLTVLGQPLGPEAPALNGRWQEFANGAIFWSNAVDRGVSHNVIGDIYKRWVKMRREVGESGYPLTDELPTPDQKGRYNHFEKGLSIYWYPGLGAQVVKGMIRNAWAAQGWEQGKLGYPTGEEINSGGLITQSFQHGTITWDGKNAVVKS